MSKEDSFPLDESINFHTEDVNFELSNPAILSKWFEKIISEEKKNILSLNFIFCSDDYLHDINVEYLEHDTFTDVITFQYTLPPDIEGDIFISIDRVRENAQTYHVTFEEELSRVMIHGVLHLCGYSDKTEKDKAVMTTKEEEALALLANMK